MGGSGASSVTIHYEQAVYGSFPFWDKGYAVLAQSPGCLPEWLTEMRDACQRFGERPGGVAEAEVRGVFALRLTSGRGPWMIVGAGSPGSDDRGRPGALAFHALFLSPRDYRRLGCDPFALTAALRNDWTAATRNLSAGIWTITSASPPNAPLHPYADRIAAALVRGHRVAIEAAAPIDTLARQVWRALPARVRRRARVATWAFGNGNRFDLVALPRLAGVALDASYLDLAALDVIGESSADTLASAGRQRRAPALSILIALGVLAALITGLAWYRANDPAPASPAPVPSIASLTEPESPPPNRAAYRDEQAEPEQSRQVAEALLALAERFGVSAAEAGSGQDEPSALMVLLADRLRYRGPLLSAAERASLAVAPRSDRDSALALRWHARIRRFAADRPLPGDFAHGPLGWQLATLAWSFHLDPDEPSGARRSPSEVVHALGEALANDLPLAPCRLSERHRALATYRDFLGRLPRR
jgi:hypothetical protein